MPIFSKIRLSHSFKRYPTSKNTDIYDKVPIFSFNDTVTCDNRDSANESLETQVLDEEVKVLLENSGIIRQEVISKFIEHDITASILPNLNDSDLRELGITSIGERKRVLLSITKSRTSFSLSNNQSNRDSITSLNPTLTHFFRNGDPVKVSLLRLFLSALYAFLAVGVTSFAMVLVHEKVPDMSKYPPLPDIILDNIPYISWAFEATEITGLILMFIWILVLVFHKHRFILIRRQFSLFGTIFLLRSITMYITSLSVPGKHLAKECKPYVFNYMSERLSRALEIWFGFGMTIRGVRTCGDYMFSGHTTCLTLLNFLITEYTPSSFVSLHIFSWILNVFGVFFILAAHEHYSIDVFIAMYITSRLFLYYHTLANNSHFLLDLKNNQRTAIWFPLFHFFEGDVRGKVPNEFENPFYHPTFRHFIDESANECFVKEPSDSRQNNSLRKKL